MTTGTQIDRDGYTVILIGAGLSQPDSRRFPPNGAETYRFNGVDGTGMVELKDVADNCSPSGRNPRTVDIVPGDGQEREHSERAVLKPGVRDIAKTIPGDAAEQAQKVHASASVGARGQERIVSG